MLDERPILSRFLCTGELRKYIDLVILFSWHVINFELVEPFLKVLYHVKVV